MAKVLHGRALVAGRAEGRALVSAEPLSFWGGLDPHTGEIIDRRHDRSGQVVIGRILVFPQGKGSSTSSAILLESVRAGTAPAAIINSMVDPIVALGSIVAEELYHRSIPVVVLEPGDFGAIREGDRLVVDPDGTVRVLPEGA